MSVLDELFLFADASNLKPPSVGVAIDSDLDFLEDPPGASDLEVLQQPSGSGGQPQLPFFPFIIFNKEKVRCTETKTAQRTCYFTNCFRCLDA